MYFMHIPSCVESYAESNHGKTKVTATYRQLYRERKIYCETSMSLCCHLPLRWFAYPTFYLHCLFAEADFGSNNATTSNLTQTPFIS